MSLTRGQAEEADREDQLGRCRDLFVTDPGGPIYLDGNSLGRQPRATAAAVSALLDEWATGLVTAWGRWADLPHLVGDGIGQLVGAAPGQVVVADSTTVNLYKLAAAALGARPGRRVLVGDVHDFPTVRYVLQGLAAAGGHELRLVDSDPQEGPVPEEVAEALGADVALCCLSAVNFRSGAVADMAAINRATRLVGVLNLWDLSHAAGVVPVQLDEAGADLAVGCGYKYLNGGPGAPAWLYVRRGLQSSLHQPVWGWWGQQDQFEMGAAYEPQPGMGRYLSGTPAVLGTVALRSGIEPLLEAGMGALWDKTRSLVSMLAQGAEEMLVPLGASIASPAHARRRGGHLAVSHPQAWAAARLLIEGDLVVPDFRPPDVLRLAPIALYTSHTEVYDALHRIATVLASPEVHLRVPKGRIT